MELEPELDGLHAVREANAAVGGTVRTLVDDWGASLLYESGSALRFEQSRDVHLGCSQYRDEVYSQPVYKCYTTARRRSRELTG